MRAQAVFENVYTTDGMDISNSLNIDAYRDRIPWNNLPTEGLWRILSGTNDDLDTALVYIGTNGQLYVVKNWLENGGEWATNWLENPIEGNFTTFLKDNRAFDISLMKIEDESQPPSWTNIKMDDEILF